MSRTSTFKLPDGARVLGALWRALDLRLPKRHKESGGKFLRGKRTLRVPGGVLRDMAVVLMRAGYIPSAVDGNDRMASLLSEGAALAVARWDQLVGQASALCGTADCAVSLTRYLRLAAIDIAIRVAAVDVLVDTPLRPGIVCDRADTIPTWARERGARDRLAVLLKTLATGRSSISTGTRRTKKRATFGKAKDDWLYRGSRPSLSSLKKIAQALGNDDDESSMWLSSLAWDFALEAICNDIAPELDRSTLEEIAVAFCRVRRNGRQLLAAESERAGEDDSRFLGLLADLILEGAHAGGAAPLIDRLVECELATMAVNDDVRFAWAIDLRACSADWILSEFAALVPRQPIEPEGVPDEVLARIVVAIANRNEHPQEFVDVCFSDPAALTFGVRLAIQRAFINGDFLSVAPMVAKLADAFRTPPHQLEAGLLYALAGRFDIALRYLDVPEVIEQFADVAKPLVAVMRALSGDHAVALAQLEPMSNREHVFDYARAVALRGIGQLENALTAFEKIIDGAPRHAMALEGAARCCFDLARSSRGKVASAWATKGNRLAKRATSLGRPTTR